MASDLTPQRAYGLPPESDLPGELGLSADQNVTGDAAIGRRAVVEAAEQPDNLPAPVPPPSWQALPEPPAPSVAATSEPPPATEQITCPECGRTADVILNRRDSEDFCQGCDYPLFWVPSRILLGRVNSDAASLRRLPGTMGRTTVASLECPHCEELNTVTAVLCVRCGLELRPTPVVAEPPPLYREPEPEPEPEEPSTWWAWLILILAIVTVLGTLIYLAVAAG